MLPRALAAFILPASSLLLPGGYPHAPFRHMHSKHATGRRGGAVRSTVVMGRLQPAAGGDSWRPQYVLETSSCGSQQKWQQSVLPPCCVCDVHRMWFVSDGCMVERQAAGADDALLLFTEGMRVLYCVFSVTAEIQPILGLDLDHHCFGLQLLLPLGLFSSFILVQYKKL